MTTSLNSTSGLFRAVRLLCIFAIFSAATIASAQHTVSYHPAATAISNYGSLPLSFEANNGQAEARVRFIAHGDGYSLFLTDSEAVLAMGQAGAQADSIRMKLAGAAVSRRSENPSLRTPVGEDELPGKVNYFIGNDPAKWRTDLPTYAKVRYRSVYPGVDLLYYGNRRQLEYDFVIAPGASPSPIKLEFAGARKITIATDGDLILAGTRGEALFHKPIVYQDENGQRKPVEGTFKLLANNTVGFSLGSYDHSRQLIIDPVLVYSTYLGGSGDNGHGDQGNGIAVDAEGSTYIVGTSYSPDFPVSDKAFQSGRPEAEGNSPKNTVFVSRFNPTGTGLIYSTYLGGSSGEEGYGIAIDSQHNAYVTGITYSPDFPVVCGAIQTTNNEAATSAPTGFVVKLNLDGRALLYSTFLGGSGNHASPAQGDVAQAISVDSLGDAYVTGYTYSADFPVTDAAFQTKFAGSAQVSNVFVTKINPGGTALAYSTFLGGSGSNGAGDYGNAIAIDGAGDAFVAGSTQSLNFPVTKGSYQVKNNGSANGQPTAFVTKLNPAGADAIYSTYLGGSGGDAVQAIAVDSGGFAYVAGDTGSTDFPLTAGVFENVNNGIGPYIGWHPYPDTFFGSGAFVAKLHQSGAALVYSTFLQGQATDVTGLAVDGAGNAYVAGSAPTVGAGQFGGFQQTPDALPTPVGGTSGFLVKLDPFATVLNYATMVGGSNNDSANALALDGAGSVYLTGSAASTNFPTTSMAFQSQEKASGSSNAFVSKFAIGAEANQTGYPAIPSNIGTSLSSSGGVGIDCYEDVVSYYVDVTLTTDAFGPPPTGEGEVDGLAGYIGPIVPNPGWGNGGYFGAENSFTFDGNYPPQGAGFEWQAYYSGDSVYSGSSTSGAAGSDVVCPCPDRVCPPPDSTRASVSPVRGDAFSNSGQPGTQSNIRVKIVLNSSWGSPAHTTSTPSKTTNMSVRGPKYIPQPAILRDSAETASGNSAFDAKNSSASNCLLPNLTVSVVSASRRYGTANPSFNNTVDGLKNGDTVTVALSTTATPTSSAGYYPITATVSGAAASNYRVLVEDGTLHITPVPLTLIARNVAVTYGQSPTLPLEYYFSGFVSGDTASVVSGAPVLTTSVTSTTPRGSYPIDVQVGTLTAANYTFRTSGSPGGQGSVGVTKAPLTVTANSVTVTEGGTMPPLTYTIKGFVNGDDASVVSGTAQLSTTVNSSTKVGEYPISVNVSGLSAENYYFVPAVHGGVVFVAK